MATPRKNRMRTTAVHGGEPRPLVGDAVTLPIFQSSTYLLGDPESFDDIRYIRLNNTPNHDALHEKLALLEGAEAALVTSSGTAAISMALYALLDAGDHVIAQDRVYGGTRKLLEDLERRREVRVTFVPGDDPQAWQEALRPETRLFYAESMTNPLLEIPALDDIVSFCRGHDLLSVVDNTFATPMNLRPVELGFDLVLHSASKYLNGHSDVVAGAVAGREAIVGRVRRTMNLLGGCLDPHACFLLQRGLKTLPVRVPAQNDAALRLARILEEHPKVLSVRHPGLASSPDHARARRWFDGFGAMVTLEPTGGTAGAEQLMHNLHLAHLAPSLGGVETLVCRPANTSHRGLAPEVRARTGVTDHMVRVSVGIEDPEDLIEDFLQALEPLPAP